MYPKVFRAYCADFDGDGDADRAGLYQCCTGSSPSPVVILRNNGATYAIAYKRFRGPVFRISGAGRALVLREPKYSGTDATCCPSHLLFRSLRWTGTRFKSSVRIRRT